MNVIFRLVAGLAILTASLAFAQEERSTRSEAAATYWNGPRVDQIPPAATPEKPALTQNTAGGKVLTIDNDTLTVEWNPGPAEVTVTFKPTKRQFLKNGSFKAAVGTAKVTSVKHKNFGSGKAVEVSYPNGDRDVVMLYPTLPFALFRSTLHNGGSASTVTRAVRPFQGGVDLGKPANQLKSFGTGGLVPASNEPGRDNPGSYSWLTIADPQSRNGVVFGWLTHDRGSGVLFSRPQAGAVQVGAQIDYGRLRLDAGETEDLETLAVGYFDDARVGLETWADNLARIYDVKLREQPVGYCTWYSKPHGQAADQVHLKQLAQFAAKELAPFGFSVVQIDDGWQAGFKRSGSPKKDFRMHNPEGPYPAGMKAIADEIKKLDLVPGVWFMPFAGTATDPFFTNHLDWFAKTASGKPFDTPWGGTCLDMTHPGARAHLKEIAGRICRDWGYDYIKVDGLWTGSATRQEYVNSGYKDDQIGEAVFHNPKKTNVEVYRDGLKLLREAAGRNVFILGCNSPQNMRSYGAWGLVDAMRVGPDNNAEWSRLTRGPLFGSRHYFLHGRVWLNDPDPVYARDSMPLKHAQLICSWVAISGQLNLSSEWLPGLAPERLEILKRTMPGHGLLPRPADLFDKDLPSLWLVTDNRHTPRRDVIGVFNWSSDEQKYIYPLDRLGLDAQTEYVGFDFWQNALVPSLKGNLQLTVPGESCRIVAVRPRANHPQLLSTSRHVTQGIIDVTDEKWDGKTLSGRSKIVGNDPYELRIVAPDKNWSVQSIKVSGDAQVTVAQTDELIRATIRSAKGGDLRWTVRFK